MIEKIDHIGIAVKDLENSFAKFKNIFNISNYHQETVEEQKVKIISFLIADVRIELTAPTDQDSPIHKFLEKRGEGIHHIAFKVDKIIEELDKLKNLGINLINDSPVDGAHNMKIAFLHPKSTNGVLIELCTEK